MAGNLSVSSAATLDLNTFALTVGGTVTNNGALRQTQTLSSNNTLYNFLNISTNKYYGVNITTDASANLGSTIVNISGNQTCSDWTAAGSQISVKRCYAIDPTTTDTASSVVFYYTFGELNGQTPSSLWVWAKIGTGAWTKILVGITRSACVSGQLNCSVTLSNLSLSATNTQFVLSAASPLAVTLAEFGAVQQGDAVLLTWETNSELNTRGFNLYRGVSPAAPDRQLNEALIPSQSQGSPGGFIYTWEDRADLTPDSTYYYWVEDVNINGAATMYGPVSVNYTVPTAVTLSGLRAGGAPAQPLPWLWAAVVAGLSLALSRFFRRAGRQNG